MTATIHGGAQTVFVGDSITAAGWMTATGGLVDQVDAQIPPVTQARLSTLAGGAAKSTLAGGAAKGSVAAVTTQATIRVVNSGVSGNQTSDIAAAVPARITSFNPDVVVLLVGVNDVINSIPTATSRANYDSILSQIRAWSSTVTIVCVSVLWEGEQWAAGPVWQNAPTYDAPIDALNAAIVALCATYSATFIDMRSPALTYEAAHNTPAPGVAQGVLSLDRIHPNPTGQVQMGSWGIGSFTVVP